MEGVAGERGEVGGWRRVEPRECVCVVGRKERSGRVETSKESERVCVVG